VHRKLEHKKVLTIFDLTVNNRFYLFISHQIFISGGSSGGSQHGNENQQSGGYVEVTVEPNDAAIARGEKVNLTCTVKGAEQYTVTWGKYAHDTSLPDYARVCIN
jgi:hypothetical protein